MDKPHITSSSIGNSHAFCAATNSVEKVVQLANDTIGYMELKRYTRPYGVESIIETYNSLSWFAHSEPGNVTDPNGFNMIDVTEFSDSGDEPISPGYDSYAKDKKIETIQHLPYLKGAQNKYPYILRIKKRSRADSKGVMSHKSSTMSVRSAVSRPSKPPKVKQYPLNDSDDGESESDSSVNSQDKQVDKIIKSKKKQWDARIREKEDK